MHIFFIRPPLQAGSRPYAAHYRTLAWGMFHSVLTECMAIADFWRTFHHDGKISPGWWGWGLLAHHFSLYLPSRTKLHCTLQRRGQILPLIHLYPYMYSVVCPWGYPFGQPSNTPPPPPTMLCDPFPLPSAFFRTASPAPPFGILLSPHTSLHLHVSTFFVLLYVKFNAFSNISPFLRTRHHFVVRQYT